MTALEKFIEAFPTQYKEMKSDYTISLGKGATVYFRKTVAGPNEAQIRSKSVKNFPNTSKLQSYFRQNRIPIDQIKVAPRL